ncbi:MAG: hypothetical protein Q8M57_03995 [Nitrosomonas sp.]|uniref:hypothetical protein n=1 Tax=Nitrosomonas sp. TaxID=42353 RepID=UPI00272FB93C|nr:hypothetical protein [Nitrosomonas sp.]MDP1935081.1 hypothetical protein [Nitrosomonas sp.]MDP3280202.1 hypothetical protein [Nitrosomonas sp.]
MLPTTAVPRTVIAVIPAVALADDLRNSRRVSVHCPMISVMAVLLLSLQVVSLDLSLLSGCKLLLMLSPSLL